MANRFKTDVVRKVSDQFVKDLEKEAKRFLSDVLSKVGKGGSSYKHDTKNLYDSYGYGIYLNGQVIASSTTKSVATEPRVWYGDKIFGAELAKKAFGEGGYKPSSQGYVVVFGAVMPYGSILESGSGNLKRKYDVIVFMEDEAMKFGEGIGMKGIVEKVNVTSYNAL